MNQNTVITIGLVAAVVGLGLYLGLGSFSAQEQAPKPSNTEEQNSPAEQNATTTPQMITIGIGLIALEDNGASGKAIGCNDSVVLVQEQVPYTVATLHAALSQLLSLEESTHAQSGLYNALANSSLSIDELEIEDGIATVELTGSLMLGGVCDSPRVAAQLEETVLQFATVQEAQIFINGEPLEAALSQQ